MGRGFMRQSVHPMDDSDSQELATETSSDFVAAESKALGERMATEDDERGPSMPTDAQQPAKVPQLVSMNSHAKVNGATGLHGRDDADEDEDGAIEVLPAPAATEAKAPSTRVLTFADETGGVLVEMNYSNRTHYSKQATPGVTPGVSRSCCVIQ